MSTDAPATGNARGSSRPSNGPSNGPKEGIYLDATLAVIGQQLDERIDELSRRRRIRLRAVFAAVSLFAVASGSVAAYAATTVSHSETQPVRVASAIADVRCVDALDGNGPAYFAVHYRADVSPTADPAAICASAGAALAADPSTYRAMSPDAAIAAATTLVADAGAMHATVQRATFGVRPASLGSALAVCAKSGGTAGTTNVVLTGPVRAAASVWQQRCALLGSHYLGGGQ